MLGDRRGGTRFEPPTSRRESLVRARLVGRLDARFATPVTVVVAPAGFGKTTLLAQAVAENRIARRDGDVDVWLTCGPDDAAVSSLADGLCQALGVAVPRRTAGAVLPDVAVDTVAEALWHRSPRQVALVLDDVHEIPAGSPGAGVLARLVARLPRNGHLVLSGRRPPPVPLARLELAGDVVCLDGDDLAFTPDELDLFAELRQVPSARLAGRGAWPALVELAASAQPDVEVSYVWEEVLARLEPEQRRALALLAYIGPFEDELAAAVLGPDADPGTLLADVPLVGRTPGGARVVHSLWRPALRDAVGEDEVAAARRRAGLHLASSGNLAAGVRLLAEAEAWDDLTGVVVDALGAASPPVPGDVVATWLGRLPAAMAGGPLARLLGAVGGVETGRAGRVGRGAGADPAAATRELEEAADAFRSDGNPAGELACVAQITQIAWWNEDYGRLLESATRIFQMEAEGHGGAVSLACLARALMADVANDSDTTLAELDRIPAGTLNAGWQSLADWLRSVTLTHLGRPLEALHAADSACALADPVHRPVLATSRLQAMWFLERTDEVLRSFPRLVERTESSGLRNYTATMAATYATMLGVHGRADEATAYLERARRAGPTGTSPLVAVNVAIAEAVRRVAQGDERAAATVLHAHLGEWPGLGVGLAAAAQRRSLVLWYVLVPGSRVWWDGEDLPPLFRAARSMAHTLAAMRESGSPPLGSLPIGRLPPPGVVRALTTVPWAVEVALAHIDAGDDAGWDLLDALWPEAQPHVRRHAEDAAGPLRRAARLALGRLPVPPGGAYELRLLGPIELDRDGEPVDVPDWRRARVRALLAYLALHGTVSRERIAADLWPDRDTRSQLNNLRANLTHVHHILEPDRSERDAPFLVRSDAGRLTLHTGEWFTTDIARFDELRRRARAADAEGVPSVALDLMGRAVALWRGEPVELAGDGWALPEIEERRAQVVALATRAADLVLARGEAGVGGAAGAAGAGGAAGDPDEARALAEKAIGADPWCTRAYEILVAADLASTGRAAAHRTIERYRRALDTLGLEPAVVAEDVRRLRALLPEPPPSGPARTTDADAEVP